MNVLLALVMLFASSSAFAGTVYKCGNSYSNMPCESGKQQKELTVNDAPQLGSKEVANAETERCISYIRATLFDPDSAKFASSFRAGGGLVEVAGQKIYAKKYLVLVNAKNRYGGYTGAKLLGCFVSESTGQVLDTEGYDR
jgi:hypothetical protein